MFRCYSAFGLIIESSGEIPGLLSIENAEVFDRIDVRIHLLQGESEGLPDGVRSLTYTSDYQGLFDRPILTVWSIDDARYHRFLYDDGTEFVVDGDGSQVWASWPEPLGIDDTAPYISGPIIGFVLRLRGIVCLHASAVLLRSGQSIAFIGRGGAGKSTTAAAFSRLGYPVLADDIVALKECNDTFHILPAHPHLRLWDPSVRALFGTESSLPRIAPNDPIWTKRYLQLDPQERTFWNKAEPLKAIYFLDGRSGSVDGPDIRSAERANDLLEFIQNTYVNYLLSKEARGHEFLFLSRLLERVPVRHIVSPADIRNVRSLCGAILSDFDKVLSRH